jgi:hypothetical protein
MNTTITGLTYAGSFMVDSGQAMVGDPCYLNDWDTNQGEKWEPEKHTNEYSYQGASNATLFQAFGELGGGKAVAFTTGYGDGYYPVYVKLDENDRVAMVVIDFEGDFDPDA